MGSEQQGDAESVPLLNVSGLVKRFERGGLIVNALDDISVAIYRKQSIGVVGESGSGKSTLARIVMGIVFPDQGKIEYRGATISKKRSKAVQGDIQFIFQQPGSAFNPRLSILRSMADFAKIHGKFDRPGFEDRARMLLTTVGLSEHVANNLPRQLSGGQLQRAAIARALVTDPKILVADEPTSALDVSIRGQVLNVLDELRGSISIVLISHDLGTVRYLTDYVYVMKNGVIVEEGPTPVIFQSAEDAYTKRLIGSFVNSSDASLQTTVYHDGRIR